MPGACRTDARGRVQLRSQASVSERTTAGRTAHPAPAQTGAQSMQVGFIGLGAVGAKLAGSLLRNGIALAVLDRDPAPVADFVARGASTAADPGAMMRACDVVITSLPSPAASETVLAQMLPEMEPGKIWLEMSTTDPVQIVDQAARVAATGALAVECPVSGGCHRAATGNISIFAGCERTAFEQVLPLLTILGRRVLHTGPVGTASKLKVMTNYLATANLLTLCEALVTMQAQGLDMATTYEAIRISSGTSFVHETESQLILSGARDVDFTMDLVLKDIGLFQALAEAAGVPLELSPQVIAIMQDGARRYGSRAQSDRIIERLEEATGLKVLADGFPRTLIDDEPEASGYEVFPSR
ncbi:NAD(P)-dependent oxidoreductase [Puniceibacterium confluentis]|uniref:NAD(P)-dependent oxidoreductase n=1 Tax=Puniceibacterium confluentis TaxID=1958944 RepID=UPI0011B4CAC6|nr:NAD(P)-dependent oxidoreductase [Puniceibacterium confluentis]